MTLEQLQSIPILQTVSISEAVKKRSGNAYIYRRVPAKVLCR